MNVTLTTKSELLLKYREDLKKSPRMVIRTSGSTSKPLYICLNEYDYEAITEIGARCWRNAGVTPGMIVINTLNSCMWAGGTLDTRSLEKAGACTVNFSVGNTKELIKVILDLKADALSCTPSYLDKIKEVLKTEYGLKPDQLGLKFILTGGEAGVQNPDFRRQVESEWEASLIDSNYGQADSVSMFASENSIFKNGLIFFGDELLDAKLLIDDQLVEINEGLTGELIVSTLWTNGLIDRKNYRTGDIIEVVEILPSNRFRFKVIGRADEMLVIRGLNVYPSTINNVFQKCLMELGLSGKFQLHVSEVDPIQRCEIHTNVDNVEFITLLTDEVKKATSINFEVKVGEIITGNTGKIKSVLRDL